jgi:beta-1,4-mannosyl-glycoprotein beta-1,4-N-acetylglucosaminyltransferase
MTIHSIGVNGVLVDGFIFYNEIDMLKIRLEELYPVVDRFVLVESNKTFRGKPKPYYFDNNKHAFEQYLDKIVHIKLIDNNRFSTNPKVEPWDREHWQRAQISQGLSDLQPDDIVIIGDVDEIARREIAATLNPDTTVRLACKMYYYGINVYAGGCGALKAARFSAFTTPGNLRHSDPPEEIQDAGWHFSYMGDAEHISNKLSSFSHWELDVPHVNDTALINERMSRGEDIWGQGHKYELVQVDDSYPYAIRNNMLYYSKYIRS